MKKGNALWAMCLQDGNYMVKDVGSTRGRKGY